jgi:hypothetical protein
MSNISAQTLLRSSIPVGATGATGPLQFNYTIANSSVTLSKSQAVIANTASGSFTVTLPAIPQLGDSVNIIDGNNFSANNLTVARNGSTIEGLAENLVINIGGASVTLVYNGSTWEVFSQVGGQGGNIVTTTSVQTITNKTISSTDNNLVGVATLTGTESLSNKTITSSSFTGNVSSSNVTSSTLSSSKEVVTITNTVATGTINVDVLTQNILYYTANASANFTLNIRGNSTTSLNTFMEIGQSIALVFMNTNGATPYRATVFQVDGTSVTPKWQGGAAPSAGNANSIDLYNLVVLKTGNNAFTMLASLTRFA